MNIRKDHPRLTWEQAQMVLENFISQTVAKNDEIVVEMIAEWREWREEQLTTKVQREFIRDEQKDCLKIARKYRDQSRELLATLNTMMRGVLRNKTPKGFGENSEWLFCQNQPSIQR